MISNLADKRVTLSISCSSWSSSNTSSMMIRFNNPIFIRPIVTRVFNKSESSSATKYTHDLLNTWYIQQNNSSDIYSQYNTNYPAYSLFQRSDKRLFLFCEQKYKIVRYES